MKQTYDSIIVGAGPAGASAAYLLAKAGMRVLLVDKYAFPRNKLCGGLLSGRSQKVFAGIFEENWRPAIEYVSHGVSLYNRDSLLNSLSDCPPLHLTSRHVFDNYLLELAEKRGAESLQACAVRAVDISNTRVQLENGKTLQADFIIGADGVLSQVAGSLHPGIQSKQRLGIGLEIEVPRGMFERAVTMPEIYFGLVRWGYGWVFPKADTLTIGLGGVLSKNGPMKVLFQHFLEQLFGEIPDFPIKGHYLPFRRYRNAPGKGPVLLVGDAAGLVEPITGEGIAFAMQSGQFAAEAILQAAQQGDPSLAYRVYRRRYRHVKKIFDYAHCLAYLLFPSPMEKLFVKVLPKSKLLLVKQMELLNDENDYQEFLGFLLKKMLFHAFKRHANNTPTDVNS